MSNPSPSKEYPRIILWVTNAGFQAVFAVLALCAIGYFVGLFYVLRPYDGIDLNFYRDRSKYNLLLVDAVSMGSPAEKAGIRPDDQVLTINGRPVGGLSRRSVYKPGVHPGDVVVYELQRDDQRLTASVTVGSYWSDPLLLGRIVGMQIVVVSFWAIGLVLCLFVPPGEIEVRLVGLCWLAIGLVIAANGPGGWISLGTSTTMLVAACFAGVLFVDAHLYFPIPSFSAQQRRWIIYGHAAVTLLLSLLAILEDWWLNPNDLWISSILGIDSDDAILAFQVFSLLMGVGLLVRNRLRVRDPNIKRSVVIAMWGTALGLAPYAVTVFLDILLDWLVSNVHAGPIYPYTVLFSVFLPLSYAYVIYQRKLVHVDFIINRAAVSFVLVLLIFVASILILGGITLVVGIPLELALVVGILLALISLLMPGLHRTVQRWVDTVLYGCHYDFATVTASFSNRLAQAVGREALVHLLKQDLAEQMGIRQAALFLLDEGGVLKLQSTDGGTHVVSADDALCQLLLTRGEPVRASSLWEALPPEAQEPWEQFKWGQLFVPLIFEGRLQGVLVLGSRHTGDVYSDGDVRIIETVAQQGALAYTNVQLVETLRGLNRQLVRTDEAHRKRVTRDLHDTVLQHLFFVKQGLYQERDRSELIDLLEGTIQSLRQTIHDQRPPLLEQGVWLALRGLVDEMREAAGPDLKMMWYSNVTERLPLSEEQATALYRIAQEALTNAVKHAGAKNVTVMFEMEADGAIKLSITDDGVGMPLAAPGERDYHYGLAGMRERAAMIAARLSIASTPGEGTRVTVELLG